MFPISLAETLVRTPLIASEALADGQLLAIEAECEGAKYHSPIPFVLHEVPLAPSGEGEVAILCGTCRDKLEVFKALIAHHEGRLPWAIRREFGNRLRALGMRGWKLDNAR